MEKLEKAPWPRVSIQGTPWYNILTNPRYAEQFGYISPCVKDRDYYIKDGDDDDDNNGEQSDLVIILLNLGSIPDYVARKFNLNQDYTAAFHAHMSDYKNKFQEKYDVKWEFSN